MDSEWPRNVGNPFANRAVFSSLPKARHVLFAKCRRGSARSLVFAGCLLLSSGSTQAQVFSVTEFQYQGGSSFGEHPVSPSGFQHILTLQHASGWGYGENFFFLDMKCCEGADANRELYMEWYPFLSLGAITGQDYSWGPIKGIGPLGGLNWSAQAKVLKITPGFRLQLDLPGFAFANLDYLYMVDRNQGLAAGGAPKESNSHLIDFNWALPFKAAGGTFSLEGHGEWHSPRSNELGFSLPHWVLLQPQLRFDLGEALTGAAGRFYVGTEFHVWINKFGFEDADEVLPQLLLVFRL